MRLPSTDDVLDRLMTAILSFVDAEPSRQTQKRLSRRSRISLFEKLRPLFDIWKAVQPESEAIVPAVQSKPHLCGWLQCDAQQNAGVRKMTHVAGRRGCLLRLMGRA
jgi:hypothetical protein